jgi:hypothetical protein
MVQVVQSRQRWVWVWVWVCVWVVGRPCVIGGLIAALSTVLARVVCTLSEADGVQRGMRVDNLKDQRKNGQQSWAAGLESSSRATHREALVDARLG